MVVRNLSQAEIHDWAMAMTDDFTMSVILFGGDRNSCCPDGGVGIEADGEIVSVASIARDGEGHNGQPTIVGVMTRPDRRHCGYGRACIMAAIARMQELGLPLPYRVDLVTVGGLALIESLPLSIKCMLSVHE